MYLQWFKLDRLPFRLRPDPQCLMSGGEYGRAVQRLRMLLDGGQGLVTLTGEPGSGKSTILHALAAEPGERRSVVSLWQPDMPPAKLLDILHEQLGLPSRRGVAADSIDLLARHFAEERGRGRQVLIMVDDAHSMPAGTLRQLLRFLALQPPPLLLLAGDPQLLELLQWRALEKPPQALGTVHLPPFDLADTVAYVPERLRLAGGTDVNIFEATALADVQDFSGGVPALINVLCDAAMSQAMTRFSRRVSVQDVRSAARSLHWISDAAEEELPAADAPPLTPAPLAREAVLAVTHKGQPVAQFTLAAGRFVIGRTNDCDLKLEGSFVSRKHCQILTADGQSVIEDLGSTNGIAVNGGRHQRGLRHVLKSGDEIRIGEYALSYRESGSDDVAPAEPQGG
jgi:type II secretory pathway predicted ATPase ExeA